MLIYETEEQRYILIHIPKTAGRYTRTLIARDKSNKIINSFVHIRNGLDLAHIPFIKLKDYVKNYDNSYIYAYLRDPYQRLISAYFYKNNKIVKDKEATFIKFCENNLVKMSFDNSYKPDIIHYYPQYKFLIDDKGEISNSINLIKTENAFVPKIYDIYKFYNKKTITIVNNIYKRDFELFGYSMIKTSEYEATLDIKCKTAGCFYKIHSDVNNNGGLYCCRKCKLNTNSHGNACKNINITQI